MEELLMNSWCFALTEDERAVEPDAPEAGFRTVAVPHDWQIENGMREDAPGGGSQAFLPREQVGVYRTAFTAPEGWQGKRVRVLFGGVQRFCTVYLNGRVIGSHAYGYVPFVCELDGLRYGERNVLAVRVDNRAHPGEAVGSGDRWYSGAGLIREVRLLVAEPVHFALYGLRVTARPAGGEAEVLVDAEVSGPAEGCRVELTLLEPDGREAASCELPATPLTSARLTLNAPSLWSPDTPVCYRLRARLLGAGRTLDEAETVFGVRTAVFDEEEGFLLNGVPTKLWGVNLHHDGGATGAAVPPEVWRRRLLALKPLGCNTIRCAHTPMDDAFYALCDELGFLVIDEFCDKWQHNGLYFDRITDEERFSDMTTWIRRDANHPCVILWSVGNEIGPQYTEYFYDRLSAFCSHVRSLDATRGVTAALIGFVLDGYNDSTPLETKLAAVRRYAEIVDVFMGNYMEQLYEVMREGGMRKPIIGSEVRMFYRHDARTLNTVDVSPEHPYAVCKRHPWVCGALVWAGVDYLGESTGWPCRGWTGNPLDSTADWKIRAWYLAAQWREDPVIRLAVYDEQEPWDMARGLWGFPQMRSHWKYAHMEKVLHVAVMTNCDTVRLFLNNQTPRTAYASDSQDGLIHFYVPYQPGTLRAEGLRDGVTVCETALYSDYAADSLRVETDSLCLPADGRAIRFIDLYVEDAHGQRYVLDDLPVKVRATGSVEVLALDNGNAMDTTSPRTLEKPTFNGHLMILVQSVGMPGPGSVTVEVKGFPPRTVNFLAEK